MIETDKANGLDSYWYLKHLFDHVPEARITKAKAFKALLPHNVDKGMLAGPSSWLVPYFYRIKQMWFKMRLLYFNLQEKTEVVQLVPQDVPEQTQPIESFLKKKLEQKILRYEQFVQNYGEKYKEQGWNY